MGVQDRKLVDLGIRGRRSALPPAVSDPEFHSNIKHCRCTVRFGKRQKRKPWAWERRKVGKGVYVWGIDGV